MNQILSNARQLLEKIQQSDSADQLRMILPVIARITVNHDQLVIHIKQDELRRLLGLDVASATSPPDASEAHLLTIPLTMKRRGVETRLIIGGDADGNKTIDPHLVLAIAEAHAWFEDLKSGSAESIKDTAESESLPASEVSRQLPLAFLSPWIVEAILRGKQPAGLTTKGLLRAAALPSDWDSQTKVLGFRHL